MLASANTPAVPTPSRRCVTCGHPTDLARCPRGHTTLRFLDRRPILLSRQLQLHVRAALYHAMKESLTAEPDRAQLLRRFVVPHFRAVLRDHRVAAGREREFGRGFRRLRGDIGAQVRLVSRMPGSKRAFRRGPVAVPGPEA